MEWMGGFALKTESVNGCIPELRRGFSWILKQQMHNFSNASLQCVSQCACCARARSRHAQCHITDGTQQPFYTTFLHQKTLVEFVYTSRSDVCVHSYVSNAFHSTRSDFVSVDDISLLQLQGERTLDPGALIHIESRAQMYAHAYAYARRVHGGELKRGT
ncbi:uncharacterized protein V6R79_024882 [Siganus canaliculatus]